MTDHPVPTVAPELLSPAGDWEALRAAVANGADAVYFGLPQFNARHRATNFAPDDLPRIIAFAQRLGIDRVVLARELSLAEIKKVATGSKIPVEVFVHGALCVAY